MSGEKRLAIALVGNPGVGKSKVLANFAGKPFVGDEYTSTIGVAFQAREYYDFHLTVWDVPLHKKGTNPYQLVKRYVQKNQLTGIVLDASNFQEEELSAWIDQVRSLNPKIQIFLLVNKTDLINDRSDIDQRLKSVLQQKNLNAGIYYCSAKNNEGVEQAFISAVERFLWPSPSPSSSPSPSWLSQHKIWAGVNALLLAGIIAMLVIATFPFGGVLALGLPLSALAVAAILGGIALIAWNVEYALVNWCNSDKPGGGGPPDHPSKSIGSSRSTMINEEGNQAHYNSPVPMTQSKVPSTGDPNNPTHTGPSLKPVNQDNPE